MFNVTFSMFLIIPKKLFDSVFIYFYVYIVCFIFKIKLKNSAI